MDANSRVVIIGAGFGGMRAAQRLAHVPVQVTLIDRRNYHLFQPLLYQVATAGLSPHEIAYPVRAIFQKQKNLDFLLADVTGVDYPARRVHTSQGEVAYDYLIISTGAANNFYGQQSLAQNALTLKDVGDAVSLRNHLLKMFELAAHEPDPDRRRALLTFVVAGGGPTGVESAGAFSELIRLVLRRDYPRLDLDDVRVLLLEASDALLTGFPPKLQRNAIKVLGLKRVEVRTGTAVAGYDGEQVTLKSGETIAAKTLLWSAGVRAAELTDALGVEQGRHARVKVTAQLQIPGHPEVYVIGDSAYMETEESPLPMMAPVATQQAEVAVENIRAQIQGRPLKQFVYKDPGSLATIGRNAAVARIRGWQFTGFIAWVVWLVVHLIGLIGFRNKLIVLINWTWDYLFYDRAVRLITSE
jgi:NADH:quinone reductase (non-electrogenic)